MLRHKRSSSDLYGITTIKALNSSSAKDVNSSTYSMGLTSYEQKSTLSKKSNSNSTDNSSKKGDSQELIIDTYRLAKHFYESEDAKYFGKLKKFLRSDW